MGGWQYGTLVDVFYGDGKDQVPCVHFMMTSDTHMSEWKYGPEASLVRRFKDIEDIAAAPNQLNTQETSYSWQGMVEHLDNFLRIRLVSANRDTRQYTFASYHFGPTPNSSFICGLVSYTVDFDSFITLKPSGVWSWNKSHSQVSEEFTADSYYMLGDPYSYKVFPAPCCDGQISVIFSAKPVYAGDTLYYQVTLPAPGDKSFDEVGLRMIPTLPNPHDDPSDKRHYLSISDLHLQTNSDGIQSLIIQDERGNVYQRRQNCQRQDPNNILSPFVPMTPKEPLDSWFEPQWQPLDAGCIGLVAPPLTSQDSEYLVAKLSPNSKAVEYHSTQVVRYSLTAQDETIMVPMSEASVQTNVNKGQQQETDTYYHAELNVQNIYGYSVGANQPIELRSSKPVRLIDNNTGRGHSISRETSAILYTNAAGKVVASMKATDFKSPTLFARIYDPSNQLDNQTVLLSSNSSSHVWQELSPDFDAHQRLADPKHTDAQSLQKAGLLSSKNATDDNANLLRTAGSRLTQVSPAPAPSSSLLAARQPQVINPLQHISYMNPSLSNAEVNLLSGSWTVDLQAKSLSEGANVELGSFFHSIGHLFHHIVHSIQKGVKAVINGVAREVTKVALSIEEGVCITFQYVGGAVSFALDTIEHIAKAIVSVITTLADAVIDAVETLIKYLKLLFAFKDIFALTRSLERGVKHQISYVATQSSAWAKDLKTSFAGYEKSIDADIDKLCGQSVSLSGEPAVEPLNQPASNAPAGNSCVQNFVLNKFTNSMQSSGSLSASRVGAAENFSDSSMESLVEQLVSKVVVQGGLAIPTDVVTSLFDATIKGFNRSALNAVLQDQKALVHSGCGVIQEIIEGLSQMTQLGQDVALSGLNEKVPFLSWLLKLFGLDLTWGSMYSFMVAFPLHTLYAIETGHSLKSINFNNNLPEDAFPEAQSLTDSQGVKTSFTIGYIVTTQISIVLGCMDGVSSLSKDQFGIAKSVVKVFKGMFDFGNALNSSDETPVGYLSPVSSFIVALVGLVFSVKKFLPQQGEALATIYALMKVAIAVAICVTNTEKTPSAGFERAKAFVDAIGYT